MEVALQRLTHPACFLHASQDTGLAFPVLWSHRELLNKVSGGSALPPQPSPSQLTNGLYPLPQTLKKYSVQINSPIPDMGTDKSSHSPGGSAMATSASPTPKATQGEKKKKENHWPLTFMVRLGLACSSGSMVEGVTSSFNQEATGPVQVVTCFCRCLCSSLHIPQGQQP